MTAARKPSTPKTAQPPITRSTGICSFSVVPRFLDCSSISAPGGYTSMNPRTILWQSLATGVILVLMIAFASPGLAIWVSAITFALAIALNAGYAHALGKLGRSARRIQGDHLVAAYVGAGLA